MMYLDLSHVSATSCKALHGHLFLSLREPFTDTTLEPPLFVKKILSQGKMRFSATGEAKPKLTGYCHGFRRSLKSALWNITFVKGFGTYIPRHMQPSK
jgi:hypothetical protein